MEKYIALVLLSALGFIAATVAKCLGDSPSKRGEFDSVMVYATYSLFAIVLTLSAICILDFILGFIGIKIFYLKDSWVDIEHKFSMPSFTAKFFVLSLICSIFVGAAWQLYGRNKMLSFFNYINKKSEKNAIFLSGSLLNKVYNDGKDHFLVIEKGGKEIAIGFYRGSSSPKSDRVELLITAHPVYKEWLKRVRETDSSHPLNTILDTYVDITNDIVIKELDYPKEWLTSLVEGVERDVE